MLAEQIKELVSNKIPMHMPGHKRSLMPVEGLPYEIDITEIEGADDLHDAGGILAEAMRRTARLYGSRRTWYLVGGSTCGVLAGIIAAIPRGREVIAARNCHRSVYHAFELGGYRVHWVYPEMDPDFEICLGISAEEVARQLRLFPGAAGVVITSPTYEGVLSDVGAIASLCHEAGIPLIVDEAHGAHLGLFGEDGAAQGARSGEFFGAVAGGKSDAASAACSGVGGFARGACPGEAFGTVEGGEFDAACAARPGMGGFPRGAVMQGADVVVQSAHKTLPALTQTGFLHLNGDLVDEREVERQLGIFETSSPSYPLMASLEGCTELLENRGPELFAAWGKRLDRFEARTRGLKMLKIFGRDDTECRKDDRLTHATDRSKILISFRKPGITGAQAAYILRSRYGIETEMSSGYNVLAMTGLGDKDENLEALADALLEIDEIFDSLSDVLEELDEEESSGARSAVWPACFGGNFSRDFGVYDAGVRKEAACTVMTDESETAACTAMTDESETAACTILTAVSQPWEEVSLDACAGRVSAEYLYMYPPGVPFLAPGEYIKAEHVSYIRAREAAGERVRRSRSSGARCIACVREG